MSNEDLRLLQVHARRGELIEAYKSRGLYGPGGEEMRVMAPIEDLVSSIRMYVLDGKPDDSVTIEASLGLAREQFKEQGVAGLRYTDFFEGIQITLGKMGVIPEYEPSFKFPGENAEALHLGMSLPTLFTDNIRLKKFLETELSSTEINKQIGNYRLALFAVKFALKDLVERFDLPMFDHIPTEKDLQSAEQFFGFDKQFIAKVQSVSKDWDEIERNLTILDHTFHVRGKPLDLTTKTGIATLLLMSLSEPDWSNRIDQIKKANGGYPYYWNDLVYGYTGGAMGAFMSPNMDIPSIAGVTKMRWDLLSGKAVRPVKLNIGESSQPDPERYTVLDADQPLSKTLQDENYLSRIAQDIVYFASRRELDLTAVSRAFIEDNCPWFITSMRVPEGELNADQLRSVFDKLAVNGEVSVSAVAALLYQALDLTPARARLVLPRLFIKEFKGKDGVYIMQKLEEALDLPSGTISDAFNTEKYSYKFVAQLLLEDEPLLQIMDVVADTYRDSTRFGVQPEELDGRIDQMLRDKPVLTDYYKDKDAHFIVNSILRFVVRADQENEMEHYFGK